MHKSKSNRMIQLGYCIPVVEVEPITNATSTGTSTTTIATTTTTGTATSTATTTDNTDNSNSHIGHGSIDWSKWDGGQIGGTPSWLHPEYLPSSAGSGPLTCCCTNLKCPCSRSSSYSTAATTTATTNSSSRTTQEPQGKPPSSATVLNFIGQFYAPPPSIPPSSLSTLSLHIDDTTPTYNTKSNTTTNIEVFHRTIYLFACTKCHLSQCYHRIRVLRTQLPRDNPYWPAITSSVVSQQWVAHLPSTYYNSTTASKTTTSCSLCRICNFPANGKCPVSQHYFCSRIHQQLYHHQNSRGKRSSSRRCGTSTDVCTVSSSNNQPNVDDNTTIMTRNRNDEVGNVSSGIYTAMEMVVEEEPNIPTVVELPDDATQQALQSTLFPNSNNDRNNDDDDDDDDAELEQSDLNDAISGGNKNKQNNKKNVTKQNQKVFQQFTNRITERPNCRDQVLRYNCSWPEMACKTEPVIPTATSPNAGMEVTANHTVEIVHLSRVDGNKDDHYNDPIDDMDSIDNYQNDNEPLWIRSDHQPGQIPKCPYCHSERQFEFQLMPQLLHYLTTTMTADDEGGSNTNRESNTATATTTTTTGTADSLVVMEALRQTEAVLEQFHPSNIPPALIEHQQSIIERRKQQLLLHDDDDGTDIKYDHDDVATVTTTSVRDILRPPHDWGVVAVYTCPNSCSSTTASTTSLGAYREEYVWVQPPI